MIICNGMQFNYLVEHVIEVVDLNNPGCQQLTDARAPETRHRSLIAGSTSPNAIPLTHWPRPKVRLRDTLLARTSIPDHAPVARDERAQPARAVQTAKHDTCRLPVRELQGSCRRNDVLSHTDCRNTSGGPRRPDRNRAVAHGGSRRAAQSSTRRQPSGVCSRCRRASHTPQRNRIVAWASNGR